MTRVPPRLLMAPGFPDPPPSACLLLTQARHRHVVRRRDPARADPARPRHGYGLHARHVARHHRGSSRVMPVSPSAMVNTSQQVGGAIGTALLNNHRPPLGGHGLRHRPHGARRHQRRAPQAPGHGARLHRRHLVGGRHPGGGPPSSPPTLINTGRPGGSSFSPGRAPARDVEDEVARPGGRPLTPR